MFLNTEKSIISLTLALLIGENCSYILRNPECRYSANYTTMLQRKYFKSDKEHMAVASTSAKNCSLQCTMNSSCLFFNQNIFTGECEFVQSHGGTLTNRSDWIFVSTDYENWKYRGPLCRLLEPECNFEEEYCIDTCTPPGYKCEKLTNIALHKPTKLSSVNKVHDGSKAVDGVLINYAQTLKNVINWLIIDLKDSYRILFMVFHNRDGAYGRRSYYITIYVGNDLDEPTNNNVCVTEQDYSKVEKKIIFCDSDRIGGRYVHFVQERLLANYMNLAELIVYAY